MGRTARHREILRRLAIIDEGIVEDLTGPGLSPRRAVRLTAEQADRRRLSHRLVAR
jgi:hypothetical protein